MAQTRKCTNRDIDAGGNCRCGCGFFSDDNDDMCVYVGAGDDCQCWDCSDITRQYEEISLGLRVTYNHDEIPQVTVDRVARALFHERSPLASWDDAPEWRRERYLASARVALEALRETP